MKDFRMGDFAWNRTEDDRHKLYPDLGPEQRAEAAENTSPYFTVTGNIYDHLRDKGNLKDRLYRIQYKKRNRKDPASRNRLW